MVLIRSHDSVDVVSSILSKLALEGPESADLEEEFRAIVSHELLVSSELIVLPDVIEDSQVDVSLQAGVVISPAAVQRVEMHHLGLFHSAASGLPREHSAFISVALGELLRLIDSPVPVHESGLSGIREVVDVVRKDVQLIPEDMSSVSFSMESSGGDTEVDVSTVVGPCDQEVESMESH